MQVQWGRPSARGVVSLTVMGAGAAFVFGASTASAMPVAPCLTNLALTDLCTAAVSGVSGGVTAVADSGHTSSTADNNGSGAALATAQGDATSTGTTASASNTDAGSATAATTAVNSVNTRSQAVNNGTGSAQATTSAVNADYGSGKFLAQGAQAYNSGSGSASATALTHHSSLAPSGPVSRFSSIVPGYGNGKAIAENSGSGSASAVANSTTSGALAVAFSQDGGQASSDATDGTAYTFASQGGVVTARVSGGSANLSAGRDERVLGFVQAGGTAYYSGRSMSCSGAAIVITTGNGVCVFGNQYGGRFAPEPD